MKSFDLLALLEELKRPFQDPPTFRLICYIVVTLYLVFCGVTCFRDLPMGDLSAELTDQLRITYEGYTVYLRRAALLIGLAAGIYASTLARARGIPFGLAMLATVHWSNALLVMALLPPVRAGSLGFNSALYYHSGAVLPAILAWTVLAASEWLEQHGLLKHAFRDAVRSTAE